mgnify:CR=1 FL=1
MELSIITIGIMYKLLTIIPLILTLSLSAQVRYSTTKTIQNFRTSSVDGRKPVSADYNTTNVICHNTSDSILYEKKSGVITPTYWYYPYNATKKIPQAITVTSNSRYGLPKYQYYVRKSSIAGNVPPKTDFGSFGNIRCWNTADSVIYTLVRGVVTRSYTIFPYSPPTTAVIDSGYTTVGTIVATDPEGDTIHFTLASVQQFFVLDTLTGVLTVNNSAYTKFTTTKTYNLTVQACDNSLCASAIVTVILRKNEYGAIILPGL